MLLLDISSCRFAPFVLGLERSRLTLPHFTEAATPSSIIFVDAEVTLRFFSRTALRWALVISPQEPLALKDDVDFNMVHGSFYGVWVFLGGGIHQS